MVVAGSGSSAYPEVTRIVQSRDHNAVVLRNQAVVELSALTLLNGSSYRPAVIAPYHTNRTCRPRLKSSQARHEIAVGRALGIHSEINAKEADQITPL
jgi:hypothetical protein